jgi:hypothetical protein
MGHRFVKVSVIAHDPAQLTLNGLALFRCGSKRAHDCQTARFDGGSLIVR